MRMRRKVFTMRMRRRVMIGMKRKVMIMRMRRVMIMRMMITMTAIRAAKILLTDFQNFIYL